MQDNDHMTAMEEETEIEEEMERPQKVQGKQEPEGWSFKGICIYRCRYTHVYT
jgi:hypothetical protein